MEYRPLGRTGMKVSALCFGAAMLGAWGEPDHDAAIAIIETALDAGINFIDTSDVYSAGESEQIVGRALAGGRRDNVILATKFHGRMGPDPNQRGNSRRWIMRACEGSLRRLQTDWIDLYQVHRADPETDIEETLGALTDLQRAGKIRTFGCSTFQPSAIVEAHWVSERRALGRFVCEQAPYSVLTRDVEAETLPTCQRYGMGVLAWSPLGAGWLTGRYRKGVAIAPSPQHLLFPSRFDMTLPGNQAKLDAIEQIAVVADEAGLSIIDLALAFVLAHPAVTAPIIGPRTMEQLKDQLPAADVRLGADVLDKLDEIVPPGSNVDPADRFVAPTRNSDPTARVMMPVPPAIADPALRRR
jgi:aryl-alcohol dehydrogenase-like predicted oxidoreductase